MIFDRTQRDVYEALNIRAAKVQNSLPLTETEQNTLERGMLTISTLNRIEKKQAQLSENLTRRGYRNSAVKTRTWSYTDIFVEADLNRIVDNCRILREASVTYSDTPLVPVPNFNYLTWNDIERILHDIETIVDEIVRNYRECGAYICGED